MPQTHTFHIPQMHCSGCKTLVESQLGEHPDVDKVQVDLDKRTVAVITRTEHNDLELQSRLSGLILPHGYSLELTPQKTTVKIEEYLYAVGFAFILAFVYWLLQNTEFSRFLQINEVSYPAAFLIGVVASLSSCMAVVGGLLLAVSANWDKSQSHSPESQTKQDFNQVSRTPSSFIPHPLYFNSPHILFHGGRLLGFLILGGLLGYIGSFFALSPQISLILGVFVALTMLVLGLNLLGLLRLPSKLQLRWPSFLVPSNKNIAGGFLAPTLLGILSFFLPCGFTQSMQFYALSLANPIDSSLLMFSFALGTLPILALLSFSSFSFSKSKYAGIFFKTAGSLVILFALYNLYNSLPLWQFLLA